MSVRSWPALSCCLSVLLSSPSAGGQVPPDVAAVLDQYAATQRALERCEQVTDVRCDVYDRGGENVYVQIRQRGEYRRDGGRAVAAYSDRRADPFKPMPDALPPLPPASTPHECDPAVAWVHFYAAGRDGVIAHYYYPEDDTGSVLMELVEGEAERLQLLPHDRTGCWMRGWILNDHARLDDVLRGAGAAARAAADEVDGRPCTRVEAQTPGGKYAVWFDPSRGGNIVGARVERGPHDVTRYGKVWELARPGNQLPEQAPYGPEDEKARETTEITDVELARVGDVWLPVAMTLKGEVVGRDGKPRRSQSRIVSKWDLHPTFLPDTFTLRIRDGSKVRLCHGRNWAEPPLEWRGGSVVPAQEEEPESAARRL